MEALAAQLHRSVAVDSPDLVLICHSTHYDDADQARLDVLVGRALVGPLHDHVMNAGAKTWRGMTSLPASPEHGAQHARICFPLRSRYELVGFMWVMDARAEPLTASECEMANATAHRLQVWLSRRREARDDRDGQVETSVLGLLSGDADLREQSAADLRSLGLFGGCQHFGALTVSATPQQWSETSTDEAGDDIRRALISATRPFLHDSYAFAVNGADGYLVMGHRKPPSVPDSARLAATIHSSIKRLNAPLAASVTVGVGGTQPRLQDLNASVDQALGAQRVAHAQHRRTAVWADDAVGALLSGVLIPQVNPHLVPEVLRLLDSSQSQETLVLIEKYLETAGNVSATAEYLNVHRTTVYYRLGRFQETTGLDLDDGNTRLLLHLWFKAQPFVAEDRQP